MRTLTTLSALSLDSFKKLLDSSKKLGPAFDYQLANCHVITKKHLFEKTHQIFVRNEVEIIDFCKVIGSVLCSDNAEIKFVERSLK